MLKFQITKKNIINTPEISISTGSKVLIKGKNGHGKTTLLRAITGITFPDLGTICFNNEAYKFPLKISNSIKFMRNTSKFIHFTESTNVFYDNLSIKQNFDYFFKMHDYNDDKLEFYLKEFEVYEPLNKNFKDLSKGTKQKLNVILALLSKKELIIMDEPTLGFDRDVIDMFYRHIRNSRKTFIISTHDSLIDNVFDKELVCEIGEVLEVIYECN